MTDRGHIVQIAVKLVVKSSANRCLKNGALLMLRWYRKWKCGVKSGDQIKMH